MSGHLKEVKVGHMEIWRKSIPGRGNNQCKMREETTCLNCWRNGRRDNRTGEEQIRGKRAE